jgi:hypothetical protein
MRRYFLVVIILVILIASFPQDAQAQFIGLSLRFHPCIRADGLYTLRVEVVGGGGLPIYLNGDNGEIGIGSNSLWYRKNGGAWIFYGFVQAGSVITFWGIPGGTNYEFSFYGGMTVVEPPSLTSTADVAEVYSITLAGTDYPHCETCTGKPIFKMYLLARSDSYCLIISDFHPSAERQKALCFPGTDWVATSTPCVGWVCENDCWECDIYGYERLSLKKLRPIYERHLSRTE